MPTTTRRERLREQLVADVLDAALAQLQEVGAEQLSLRAIARDVGMSPAGLYRYFDGRDAVLTALIAAGYDDLADHLYTATGQPDLVTASHGRPDPVVPEVVTTDAPSGRRMMAASRALRAWGLAHPNEFGLLYGDPVRGYAAPAGGATVLANRRVGQALLTPLVEALVAGDFRRPAAYDALADDDGATAIADDIAALLGHPVDPADAAAMLGAWSRLHGIVSLDVFDQFDWIYPDHAGPLFEAEIAAMVEVFGLPT